MELGISGRIALVTGGSKGIGRAVAAALAGEGCRIALAARGAEALARGGGRARREGRRGVDASRPTSPSPTRPAGSSRPSCARFGRLDILVNNAGAIRGGDFLTTPAEQWADDWRLKILGYVRMAQAAIPAMRPGRWGRIVNVIGAAARNPATTYMAGGIANAGLINFTRALADLGAPDGILVNAVSPGPTATERWDRLAAQQAQAHGKTVETPSRRGGAEAAAGPYRAARGRRGRGGVPRLRAGGVRHGGLDHGRRGASRGVYL